MERLLLVVLVVVGEVVAKVRAELESRRRCDSKRLDKVRER